MNLFLQHHVMDSFLGVSFDSGVDICKQKGSRMFLSAKFRFVPSRWFILFRKTGCVVSFSPAFLQEKLGSVSLQAWFGFY